MFCASESAINPGANGAVGTVSGNEPVSPLSIPGVGAGNLVVRAVRLPERARERVGAAVPVQRGETRIVGERGVRHHATELACLRADRDVLEVTASRLPNAGRDLPAEQDRADQPAV